MPSANLKSLLAKQLQTNMENQLAHAHVLSGPNNSDLLETCLETLKELDALGDLLTLEKPKIKELRELQTILYQKNHTANKWIIIDDITNMSIPAQNSLLKVIEEPVQGLYFILISYNDLALLDTIASRCNSINSHAILNSDASPILGNQFELTDPSLTKICADMQVDNWREIVVKNLWDKKDMTKEDLVWVVHQLIKNINLNAKEFIDLQKTLKNILHTGSVKLNLYNLALIGQPAFNSGL